jgi:hypothetical protein
MTRQSPQTPADEPQPPLAISPEKVCFVIIKAREFDAKESGSDRETGSNPSDDRSMSILENATDDPVVEELTAFIDALSEDEQIDLVALAWLGRDSSSPGDWTETRREAARAHNTRTAAYLLGMPLLADFIEEGLSLMGLSCEEFELGRL